MDLFKKEQMKCIGPGGFHCPCCNPYRGKTKSKHVGKVGSLNRKVRSKLKEQLRKEIADMA